MVQLGKAYGKPDAMDYVAVTNHPSSKNRGPAHPLATSPDWTGFKALLYWGCRWRVSFKTALLNGRHGRIGR